MATSSLTFMRSDGERLNIGEPDIELIEARGRKVAGVMLDRDIDEFKNLGLS